MLSSFWFAVRRGRKQLCEMMKRGGVARSDAWSCHKVSNAITAPSPALAKAGDGSRIAQPRYRRCQADSSAILLLGAVGLRGVPKILGWIKRPGIAAWSWAKWPRMRLLLSYQRRHSMSFLVRRDAAGRKLTPARRMLL